MASVSNVGKCNRGGRKERAQRMLDMYFRGEDAPVQLSEQMMHVSVGTPNPS